MAIETLKLFWRATWRYKWLLIWSEVGGTLFVLANDILGPLIISQVIDKLTSNNLAELTFHDFLPLIIIFAAVRILYILSSRLMMQAHIRLEPNVIRDLENISFQKLQGHSLGFFANNFSGALVAKVNRLTNAYQRSIETLLGDFGMLARQYLIVIGILFFVNWQIATTFLVWTIIFCGSIVFMHRRKMRHSKAASAAQTRVTARLADSMANVLTVRSFARSKEETAYFQALSQERRDLRFYTYRIGDRIRLYKSIWIVAMELTVLYFSVRFGLDGTMSIGSIVLVQLYIQRLLGTLWNFGRFMDRIEEALADAAEMTEVINHPHEITDPEQPEKSRIKTGAIAFHDVNFQYNDAKKHTQLFEHFSVTISAGQKVGLVGPSGGGKTTLTKLLLRFMDIQKGSIKIDGQDISAIRQDDLRQAIAYVPQEPLLFHRSIYENIAYGNPKASKKQVIDAAKKAYAHEFILELPVQYDTIVGERGVKLSGGQRQRIALARAILKDAPILVLDEATSALDSHSEKLITAALDKLMANRTTIVVAHRLSTIRRMDRILVLADGKIIEDGPHQKLVKQKGLYAELWSHQSDNFLTG
ncbi:MAG TPA: ABC transporter ATP-binding protein [Candidatus Saccharimonadales bacterium]